MLLKCEQIYASDLKLKNDKDLKGFLLDFYYIQ